MVGVSPAEQASMLPAATRTPAEGDAEDGGVATVDNQRVRVAGTRGS